MAQKLSPSKPRLRAAGVRCPGGASSLLRLSSAGQRLPSSGALAGWLRRAAVPLMHDDPVLPR